MDLEVVLGEEAQAWGALRDVVARIAPGVFELPGVTPDGWTVKDVLVHTGAWLERCAEVLEASAAGAPWVDDEWPLDEVNAGHVALAATMGVDDAHAYLGARRDRARAAWEALGEPTADAWSWFEESGPMHYAKHTHDLQAWLAGVPSDPRVGALLQGDAEGWVVVAGLLDGLDPLTALSDPPGWTVHDVGFHVAMWLETAAADVEGNRGWTHDGDPDEDDRVDAMNDRWLVEGRGLAPDVVRARLGRARARLRAALAALPSPSDEALAWYAANTVEHHAEHLPALRLAGSQEVGG